MKLITTVVLLYGLLSQASEVTIKDNKILYKDKELHPGCMSANQYNQKPFMRNDYFVYVNDEKNIKNILKDPLLRFDGFGYKLAKKIDDKIFVIDVREFTTGSADFLTTLVVEVVENQFFKITPEGKSVSTTVVGFKKIGEVLSGIVNWQEKLNEALKIHKNFKKQPIKSDVI